MFNFKALLISVDLLVGQLDKELRGEVMGRWKCFEEIAVRKSTGSRNTSSDF
jgi:hypothetical protein